MSFSNTMLDTPSARDVDEAYGSQFLGVADVGDKKIRTKILKVRKRDVKDRDTGTLKKKIIIFFENIDKPLILNVTNKNLLVEAFGKNPAGWQNATVGIYVDQTVTFGGQKKGGVRLRALLPSAATAKPVPQAAPATKASSETASEWKEEGDPGIDPSTAKLELAE